MVSLPLVFLGIALVMAHIFRFSVFCFLVVALMYSGEARASAPFCVEANSLSLQCYYYDAAQCRKEAAIVSGNCTVDAEQIALPEGYGNYCLVSSTLIAECLYLDFNSCNIEAIHKNAVCMRNYTKPEPSPAFEFQNQDAYQSF